MDPLLVQFHRQYLQQVTNLIYPPSKLLMHVDIQDQLYKYFFNTAVDPYLPPPEYQRRVMKKILDEIVRGVKDEDDEISDELMACMGHLSSLPKQSDSEMAQIPRVLSYFLPDQPQTKISTSTYENENGQGGYGSLSGRRVLIRESPQLLAAGSNVGLRTWEACLRLAHYLCTSSESSKFQNANVLELGAGTGLLSLICAMGLQAQCVVATDGLIHVVDSIKDNIILNQKQTLLDGNSHEMPLARVLDWTDPSRLDDVLTLNGAKPTFDYILGADITYHPELLDPLASLISKLRDRFPSSKVLISATVRNENTLKLWKEACQHNGLNIRDINEAEDGWKCPQYRLQSGLFHEQAFPILIMDITK